MAITDTSGIRTIRSASTGSSRYPGFGGGQAQAPEPKEPSPPTPEPAKPLRYTKTLEDLRGEGIKDGIHPGSYIGDTGIPYPIQPGTDPFTGARGPEEPKSGGCYITTACAQNAESPRAEGDLAVLRQWRDDVLAKSPDGEVMIGAYYDTAPQITSDINTRPDAPDVYTKLHGQYIRPAVDAINSGDDAGALQMYMQLVQAAKDAAGMPKGTGQVSQSPLANVQMKR